MCAEVADRHGETARSILTLLLAPESITDRLVVNDRLTPSKSGRRVWL